MSTPSTVDGRSPASRLRIWVGIVLLALGLIGHLYAAHANGGSPVAYTHHVFGFFLILVVTGAIIAGLGWRFWRSRPDITVLTVAGCRRSWASSWLSNNSAQSGVGERAGDGEPPNVVAADGASRGNQITFGQSLC